MARVTVVNDSADFLGLMEELVTAIGHTMTGLDVAHASIEELAASAPDLIILDLILHDPVRQVSGWELLIVSRSHPTLRSAPIIVCTGDYDQLELREDELAQFADVHLCRKPFAVEEMIGLVRRLTPQAVA